MKPSIGSLSDALGERLFRIGRLRTFDASAAIFRKGDKAELLPIVLSGKVKVFRFLSPGKEVIVNVFRSGEIFAIPPVLDGTPYPANAEALEECQLLMIPRGEFLVLLEESQEFSNAIMGRMSELLRETSRSIGNLATTPPENRIARILVWLTEKEESGPPYSISLRRQDIAQIAGLATETTIRAIRRIADEGAISIIRGKIVIEDPAKLRDGFGG